MIECGECCGTPAEWKMRSRTGDWFFFCAKCKDKAKNYGDGQLIKLPVDEYSVELWIYSFDNENESHGDMIYSKKFTSLKQAERFCNSVGRRFK